MKARDLHRDPRILLHSLVTGPQAAPEVKVRGAAAGGQAAQLIAGPAHADGLA